MNINDDEYEKKKRYLKRYRKNQELIRRLNDKIRSYDDRLSGLRSPTISDMPRGSKPIDKADILSDKLETEERITRLKAKGSVYRSEILNCIDKLDDVRQAEVLEMFCIDCMSISDISEELGYTERWIASIYSEAISAIDIT